MPETYQVLSVEPDRVGAVDCWRVTYQRPDGGLSGYVFPRDTLEWRAAEYGIPPDDVDRLLDIVLHEPHIPDPGPDAVTLYTAPTVTAARDAHLARVEEAKARVRIITTAPPAARGARAMAAADPFAAVRRAGVDAGAVEEKAAAVANLREQLLAGPDAS